ncbi:MAG TPA: phosphodiester glycosidase family protein [Abditibacterium sp.]|jgi:uncharacterized protein YigE (DUF2233 family)
MRRFFVFCGLLAIVWWSIGAFRARGNTPWARLDSGIERRTFLWHGVQVHAFRADASRVFLGIGETLDARDWLKFKRARVAINGGYFDEKGKPLGLRVSQKRKKVALREANWGVFWIRKGRARIAHTRDFSTKHKTDEAIQCGPRLVVAGRATDLKPQWSRRSGIGIDNRGRVVLAVADGPLSLQDWAGAFASNDGLGCRDALNLDGGPSTQMAFQTSNKRGQVDGGWPVPDAILIR